MKSADIFSITFTINNRFRTKRLASLACRPGRMYAHHVALNFLCDYGSKGSVSNYHTDDVKWAFLSVCPFQSPSSTAPDVNNFATRIPTDVVNITISQVMSEEIKPELGCC